MDTGKYLHEFVTIQVGEQPGEQVGEQPSEIEEIDR
jgi:hypothetical protein